MNALFDIGGGPDAGMAVVIWFMAIMDSLFGVLLLVWLLL